MGTWVVAISVAIRSALLKGKPTVYLRGAFPFPLPFRSRHVSPAAGLIFGEEAEASTFSHPGGIAQNAPLSKSPPGCLKTRL